MKRLDFLKRIAVIPLATKTLIEQKEEEGKKRKKKKTKIQEAEEMTMRIRYDTSSGDYASSAYISNQREFYKTIGASIGDIE